jgi:hypothetical protein
MFPHREGKTPFKPFVNIPLPNLSPDSDHISTVRTPNILTYITLNYLSN